MDSKIKRLTPTGAIRLDSFMEDFLDKYRDDPDFKDFSDSHITFMCKSQFDFVNDTIDSGNLEDIRLKHIGTFRVSIRKVRSSYRILDTLVARGDMLRERADFLSKVLLRYLDRKKKEK